ncbi:hypothetical protein [Segatella copri]|uniref:hypothetical protein n=1 Tax=Segatella copri TaxID=165179 RepID=UPI0025F5C323|nr:hypothetical protein [Segatella copri]WOG32961.1 hypothetical protein RJT04_04895 [Segatella copri]
MKKFFTLIAAVALAASVNAQGTYAVQVGDKVNAGDKITSVENITLTYMENTGTAFADGKATDNWADADFTAYVCGKNNGKLVKGAEPTGCVYKFETAKAGSVTVGIQLGGTKGFHILDAEFAEVAPASYNLPSAKDGESQKFTQNEKNENIIAAKSNGIVTLNVAAGGTYYVLAAGTRLGFYGFKYTIGTGTGISSVNAAAAKKDGKTYNMAGQEVSSSAKGIVIKNGKKYVK